MYNIRDLKNGTLIGLLVGAVLMTACSDLESFGVDAGARLTFGSDTVCFDTLITTISSSTNRVIVFNTNDKGVRITRLGLKHGAASHFRVNVDGEHVPGGVSANFDVAGGDSLFVLVEATLPDEDTDDILVWTDSIYFQLENGAQQYITLLAYGQNAYHWYGRKLIDHDEVIESHRPIVVHDTLEVAKGATLTLKAGTCLMFDHDALMQVDGVLNVEGDFGNPVIMRGSRMGGLFDYLPYDNTPQQWGGVRLAGKDNHHHINCLDMHSATFGLEAVDTRLTISNSVFHNSGGNALSTIRSSLLCYNTQLSNSFGDLYRMLGGETEMIFCTFAQYYNYDSERGMALAITDNELSYNDRLYWPVEKAHFYNCVVTGYGDDVVSGDFMMQSKYPDDEQYRVDYLFHNCYMRTVNSDADSLRFVRTIYETDDLEVRGESQFTRFQGYERLYDFTPTDSSMMYRRADASVFAKFPDLKLDVDGRGSIRPAIQDSVDIGAFQNTTK